MSIAENVIIEDSPSFEISDYVFRCAESLGIGRLGGYIKVSFADDIGIFSGEADGTEDRVDVRLRTNDVDDTQLKVHIAHELIHAVQILTGRLLHIGLTWCDQRHSIVYKHIFDGVEYVNVGYADQPWEEEAYRYEEEVYQTIESGGKECSEVQSAIYPHRS